MKRKIIGLCGFIGSGKDSVADILCQEYGFEKISFADRLKDGVATIFGWDRQMLEGSTTVSREWRNTPNEFWSNETGQDITPRYVLQRFGTDCMRKGFHQDIWTLIVKRELMENPNTDFVVPDVRFYNERNMLRELNGEIWRIKRGKDPDWILDAINDNRYDTNWMEEKYPDIHESEYRWLDHSTEFERTIPNDGNLVDLTGHVERAMRDKE